ncbi:MAG: sulfite exporter TauE/SafE family protein [Chloroflexota bacterium]
MFFPGAGVEINVLQLLGMGFAVGVCSGFFGFGGGFMMTPALNIFGFPMAYAIGTDLAQMAGSSIMSTLRHRKLGHVDLRLGLMMIAGTVVGVEAGKEVVMHMEGMGNVDTVVRWIYVALLGGLGVYMLREARKAAAPSVTLEEAGPHPMQSNGLASKIKGLNIPPFMSLPVSGIPKISIWVPIGIGFLTGVLAGLLGVGGGFIRMPALVYLMGVPTVVAVGTDLFEIVISGSYGAFTYALADRVELLAVAILLVGASAGVQIGAAATRYVSSDRIRHYFALTILLAGGAVLLKQLDATFTGLSFLGAISGPLLLGVAGAISLLIIILFLKARGAASRRTR